MIDLEAIRPGDVIVRDLVPSFEADRPMFVISCVSDTSEGKGVFYHVIGTYMASSGRVLIGNVTLDVSDVHDYRWVLRTGETDYDRAT